jgi:hypothetical protein
MEDFTFDPVNYSGHVFSGYFVRRDPASGPGFYVYGRNSEKYGTRPDGLGAYVKLCARPAVRPRRHPHYNAAVQRGWKRKRDAQAVADFLNRRPLFNVTFETVTPESAEHGDAETRGFVGMALPLRAAVYEWRQMPDAVESIEANDSDASAARWITAHGAPSFRDGTAESRSIHFPETLTPASRARLVRLLAR